jgi:ATP-dependent RNA helicase SUPV3L1/SUV3
LKVLAGRQAVRIDMAEKLLRAAHEQRMAAAGPAFAIDPALATSMGLTASNLRQLMREGGFRANETRPLREGAHGPPAPLRWSWRPTRKDRVADTPRPQAEREGAFAALSGLRR